MKLVPPGVADSSGFYLGRLEMIDLNIQGAGPSNSSLLMVLPSLSSDTQVTVMYTAAAAKSIQSCMTLCNPIDGSPPGSPVPGILQARTLEWVAISFSNAWKWSESEVIQLCLTLSDPMDCSPPGSSVHGIFQARVLEWGAISFFSHVH